MDRYYKTFSVIWLQSLFCRLEINKNKITSNIPIKLNIEINVILFCIYAVSAVLLRIKYLCCNDKFKFYIILYFYIDKNDIEQMRMLDDCIIRRTLFDTCVRVKLLLKYVIFILPDFWVIPPRAVLTTTARVPDTAVRILEYRNHSFFYVFQKFRLSGTGGVAYALHERSCIPILPITVAKATSFRHLSWDY